MAVRSPTTNVMVTAATKVARALNRDFGEIEQLQTSRSGSWDFTNRSFQHGARILRETLASARPGSKVYIPGSSVKELNTNSDFWIADPISGRTNFAHGIPHFAVSIAYAANSETKNAVIYDFINDNLYWAEKGAGAYRNDRRIRVSKRYNTPDLVIGNFEDPLGSDRGHVARANVAKAGSSVRILGSPALDLAFVASGVFDGFWSFSAKPAALSSGQLLIGEAGGLSQVGISGHNDKGLSSGIAASNGQINARLIEILGLK
ncbi:MAG: inositol monophosphatase family protein [Pseudomonadota bacterium]|nr:inositol monophosphatase family protein [Pseudomonadota bacterium]